MGKHGVVLLQWKQSLSSPHPQLGKTQEDSVTFKVQNVRWPSKLAAGWA